LTGVSDSLETQLANEIPGDDFQTDLRTLQSALAAQNLTIPLLFKHYSQATSRDGVSFSAFNVDPAFGDCVDAFVIADLTRLLPKKKRRYLGEAWQHHPINQSRKRCRYYLLKPPMRQRTADPLLRREAFPRTIADATKTSN
jgi:hypothetical protein